jgi:glycosyltransferase involved in cell wall biosynthesis
MMDAKNLLVIGNTFPDIESNYVGDVFVKEQVKYLKNYFEKVYVISPAAYGIEQLRKTHHKDYGFDNVRVYFPRYVNFPLFYYYSRNFWIYLEKRAILKLLKKENISFDLIHAHFTWPSGAVAVELKSELEVPVVITEHTSTTFKKIIDKKDSQYIKTWKLSDAIIRVRKNDIHFFDSVGIPLDKVYCVPNGYDDNKFAKLDEQTCRKKLNLPLDKKIILNVGNLYGDVKGHKYFIEAMKKIVRNRKDVLCIVVGSGRLKHALKNQIKEFGLEGYVKLVGGKPHDEIPIWMNACDVFVMPSLRESFGVVQIEAMACGKPIVATYNGGSEEIIISEDYGLLVKPANPEDLAEKILIALDKEWDSEKIVEYVERFRWKEIAGEILDVYVRVLR